MNIAKETECYIMDRPSIKDCVKKDMINYSKLARAVIRDCGMDEKDFDAVLIACRRVRDKLSKEKSFEKPIIDLLKKSKVEIKNKMIVGIVERSVNFDLLVEIGKEIKKQKEILHLVEGTSTFTLITSEEFEDLLKNNLGSKLIKIEKNLVEIVIKSSEELESTPGVVAYLYSLFGEYGINIAETTSCWTDTIFVIEKKYFSKAVEVLKF